VTLSPSLRLFLLALRRLRFINCIKFAQSKFVCASGICEVSSDWMGSSSRFLFSRAFHQASKCFSYIRSLSHHVALAFCFQTMKMIASASRFPSDEFESQTFNSLASSLPVPVCALSLVEIAHFPSHFSDFPAIHASVVLRRRRRALLSMLNEEHQALLNCDHIK
jgi:hypothetical protein